MALLDPASVTIWSAAIVGALAAIAALYKVARMVAGWFWKGFKLAVTEVTETMANDVSGVKTLTEYHLGPNGQTQPIHKRLSTIEAQMSDTATKLAERQRETE